MNCPLCIDQTLDITYHGGIEIDICPKCRGVWLDRGELEKLAGSQSVTKSSKQASPKNNSGSAKKKPEKKPGKKAGNKSTKSSKSKKKKKKSLGSRLGDVLEEVLDL